MVQESNLESRLEGEVRVKDFGLFLEKSKQGINLVYQLHRDLGSTFVDASFQDKENPSLLFKMRVHLDPPKLAHSDILWDEHGFPYELETYISDDTEVVVPLYRNEHSDAMAKFLEDVAEYEIQDGFKNTPQNIREGCLSVISLIQEISRTLKEVQKKAGDRELKAVDTYFGEAGIFGLLDDSFAPAIVQFLKGTIQEKLMVYKAVKSMVQEERQKALIEAENRAVKNLENTFKKYNFKQGFVSTEVVVR